MDMDIENQRYRVPNKVTLIPNNKSRPVLREVTNKVVSISNSRSRPALGEVTNKANSFMKSKIITKKEKNITSSQNENISHIKNPSDLGTLTLQQSEVNKLIDENDEKDIFLLGRYVQHIYKYLLKLELEISIKPDFLFGTNVSPRMRATLIDWLMDVQTHYSFLLETFYLTVSIIDRFLQSSGVIQRKNFQLVGITAMFLACKFEETYYTEVSDFIYMTDNAYSKQQVLDLERDMIKKLDFRLGRPISLTFLRRYSKIIQADQYLYTLGKYFIELALLEFSLASVRPSKVAAAAIYIAMCIKANDVRPDLWTPTLQHYSTYNLCDFQNVTKKLACSILEVPYSKYKGIKDKYSRSEFLSISISKGVQPTSTVLQKLSLRN